MSKAMTIIISIAIGLVLYGVGYLLLKKTEEATIKDKDYEGELTEIKWSWPRLIVFTLIGVALTAVAGCSFGLNLGFILITILFFMLTIAAFVDARMMVIPFYINIVIIVLGIASIWVFPEVSLSSHLIGAAAISIPMIIINLICQKTIGRDGFGGGDIKLMLAAGLMLGVKGICSAFFMGCVAGAIVGIFSMTVLKKKGKDPIPFGPSLCIGIVLATLFGTALIDWYINIVRMSMNPPA